MSDAIPYAPTVLDAVGESTDWMDLATLPEGAMFIAVIANAPTFVFQIANDETGTALQDKSDQLTVATYTASVAKVVSGPGMPRFGRIKMTAGAGSVTVSWGKARNTSGKLTDVNSSSRQS